MAKTFLSSFFSRQQGCKHRMGWNWENCWSTNMDEAMFKTKNWQRAWLCIISTGSFAPGFPGPSPSLRGPSLKGRAFAVKDPVQWAPTVGVDSWSSLFNHGSFQENRRFPRVSGGFLARRIPGKNGEGRYPWNSGSFNGHNQETATVEGEMRRPTASIFRVLGTQSTHVKKTWPKAGERECVHALFRLVFAR